MQRDDDLLSEYCPNCGKYTGGDSICPECGTTIYDDSGLEEVDEEEEEDGGGSSPKRDDGGEEEY